MHVLIIGSGSIGRRHADSLKLLDSNVSFTFLRRRNSKNKPGIDLDGMVEYELSAALEAKPDIAIVATPSSTHVQSIIPLLEAQIPCYIEKPLVTSFRDIELIERYIGSESKLPTTHMGCNLRFMPSLIRLRNELKAGVIGNPVRATLDVGQWLPDWRPLHDYRMSYSASSSLGGGVIFDLVHELDMARWLFGEFTQIQAIAGKRSNLEIESEDVACIGLAGKTTPLVNIGLDYVSRLPTRRYCIVGESGNLVWDLREKQLIIETTSGAKILNNKPEHFDIKTTYPAAMKEFLHCINANVSTTQDIHEGIATATLALQVRKSAGLSC